MKKIIIAALLTMASINALATGLPVRILTHSTDIESINGVMTYSPLTGDCQTINRRYDGKLEQSNEAVITFKRNVWDTMFNKCGAYTFTEGRFTLKLKGQEEIPFIIKRGKLMNNYNRGWGHVLWGAWVDSTCSFRDGQFTFCDAGSDSTWGGKERPFVLFISPMYPMFQWNITENIR
jgi:hypothetical protein